MFRPVAKFSLVASDKASRQNFANANCRSLCIKRNRASRISLGGTPSWRNALLFGVLSRRHQNRSKQ